MIFNMVGGGAGGAGGGATLVVSSPANVSVTVSKDDKSYTKNSGSLGSTTFKGLATGTWTIVITGNGQTATRTIEITADYAITIAFFSASINITYPATSTCVVKNSSGQTVASNSNTGTSAKTWTTTVNATGSYTVTATATDGSGNIKSQSVEITTTGQSVSVELNYRYYLYNSGTQNVPWSQGSGGSGTLVFNSDHMLLRTNDYPTWAYTSSKQSRGAYTKLGVTCVVSSTPGDGVRIGLTSNITDLTQNTDSKFIASKTLTASGEQTAYVDISSVSVTAYVTIFGTWNSGNTKIKAVWFE